MPLKRGQNSIRSNVMELMKAPQSQPRKKAIVTIAKTRNMSLKQAQFLQSLAIAKELARKS